MEAGDYDTNTLLINNLSAVCYRIYEPIASHSYTFNASDVHDALRNDGHLVYTDIVRHGIWCFYLSTGDPAMLNPESIGLHAMIEVCGYTLGLVGEGHYKPIDIFKSRMPGMDSINTPSSSSSAGFATDMTLQRAQSFNLPTPTAAGNVVLADVKGYASVPIPEIHRYFMKAVLSSLTTYICRQIGAIALNNRAVLLPPEALATDDVDPVSALATFRVYMTTTGSLVISLSVSLSRSLVSCSRQFQGSLMPPSPVLAAPFGHFGSLQGVLDTDNQVTENGFVQSPDTQIGRLRSGSGERFSQWKTLVCDVLKMHGMSSSLLNGCSWLNVHFSQRKPYEQRADGKNTPLVNPGPNAPWPSVLCFRRAKMEPGGDISFEKALPGTAGEHGDPLNMVKSWCQGLSKREEDISQRRKDREAAALREKADVDGRNVQLNGHSPMNPRRPSNGGAALTAAGVMYPTPPDGILQPTGVMPMFDATTVSPANPPSNNVVVDLEATMQQDISMTDGFGGGWDATEPKPEPTTAGFTDDHMYGDLDEDMFGGNELTDADFNFFDQPADSLDLDPHQLDGTVSSMDFQLTNNTAAPEPGRAIQGPDTRQLDPMNAQPQFTKPELKHARSILAESRQQTNAQNFNHNSAVGIKRQTSPFTPETVFKKIKASLQPIPPPRTVPKGGPPRRRSVFEKVEFSPALSLDSVKYQASGPFTYQPPTLNSYLPNNGPLTTGRLLGSAKQRRSIKELPFDLLGLQKKINGAGASPAKKDEGLSDDDESSLGSDDDTASNTSGHASSPAKSSVLRRRPDDDVVSMAASFKDLETFASDSPGYSSADLARLSNSEVPELSLTRWFADPEPVPLRISVSDDDFITVAQVLTEQAAGGTLKLEPERPCSEIRDVRRGLVDAIRYSIQALQRALPQALMGASECHLRSLAEVQDVPLLVQPVQPQTRLQIRPADVGKPAFQTLPAPHIEVRRNNGQLALLPSALSFWESLGLGPAQGAKDIVAVCVFPHGDGMRDNASVFLERMRSTYELMNLGAHNKLPTTASIVDGLVSVPTDQGFVSPGMHLSRPHSVYTDHMANLALSLANVPMTEKNFVIYFAYLPENPTSILDSCCAFQELFEHYKRCMLDRKKQILNELVLQLIPLNLVASDTSIVILSTPECMRLCIETYDRCTLFGGPMPAPAIMLESALPREIPFRISANPSPDVLHENSHMHIAYAQSTDERWITAAWTDNRGQKQMTASYCLGRRNKPLTRHLSEVISEIWDTTYDLVSSCKVSWKIIVTKSGTMDPSEADLWIAKCQDEQRISTNLTLITVDINPSLQLIPPQVKLAPSAQAAFYTTPVSTPQPFSVLSPDQSSNNPPTPIMSNNPNPATPIDSTNPGDLPPDQNIERTLVDVCDVVHSVVLSHRLNNSLSLTEINPSLASGYLVKRNGTRTAGAGMAEDAPSVMEVNVIYSDQPSRMMATSLNNVGLAYEGQLREVMGEFRGLGTLARARGVVVGDRDWWDLRPWHVGVVERGVRVLGLLM
ncbi:mediator complex subunit 13 C-terminal-domain-containing protein [Triangularia verruculosa]|uniref:Mediator of RNA polymerase II transcription subunit 13 n=1 Tax=Triangularia verruculosa TaxID=2587418 RepID=A0AAN6XNQ3_9PEZI|nr:mediator complex subunit 13 C-terminal-domain-containing protein [Triangularia verruculosa]